ncbi:MAG: O-antigen polymerase [Candidatus Acidiferrales bacterium]
MLYPPALFTSVWLVALVGLALSANMFYPISDASILIYIIGGLSFSAGGFLVALGSAATGLGTTRRFLPRWRVHRALLLVVVVSVLLLPLYGYYLQQVRAAGPGGADIWQEFRSGAMAVNDLPGGGPLWFLASAVPLFSVFALIAVYEYSRTKQRLLLTMAVVVSALLYNTLSTSRSDLLLLILGILGIIWIRMPRAAMKITVLSALLFGSLSVVNQVMLGKMGADPTAPITRNAAPVVDGFTSYAVGSLVAFDYVVHHPTAVPDQWMLDKFFIRTANKFGAGLKEPSQNLEYTNVSPYLVTNVYTIYFAFFLPYGYTGVVLIMAALGAFTTFVYCRAIRGSPVAILLYSALLFPIVMSVFAEEFFSQLGFWLKLLVVAGAIYWMPTYSLQRRERNDCLGEPRCA